MILFTVKEAADKLRLSPHTVYRMVAEGKIGFYQVKSGKSIRISERHILDYLGADDE